MSGSFPIRRERSGTLSILGFGLFLLLIAGVVLFVRHPPAGSVASEPPLAAAVQPARLLESGLVDAPYPAEPLRAREEGTAVLRLTIKADGSLERCLVRRSSGSEALDRAGCEGLRRSRFAPGLGADGRPVRSELDVPIAWRLPR